MFRLRGTTGTMLLALLGYLFCLTLKCSASYDDIVPWGNLAGTSLSRDIADSEDTHATALAIERLLDVPAGHLQPVFLYRPRQDQVINEHIFDSRSRFFEFHETPLATFYATPWVVQRTPTTPGQRGVLVLSVTQDERVVPLLHAGFKEGILPGKEVDFWQYLLRLATTRQRDLVRRYPRLRLY